MQLYLSNLPVLQMDKSLLEGAQAVWPVPNYLLQSALHSNSQKRRRSRVQTEFNEYSTCFFQWPYFLRRFSALSQSKGNVCIWKQLLSVAMISVCCQLMFGLLISWIPHWTVQKVNTIWHKLSKLETDDACWEIVTQGLGNGVTVKPKRYQSCLLCLSLGTDFSEVWDFTTNLVLQVWKSLFLQTSSKYGISPALQN